ncbi:unnamed protein product [Cylicocyclus nassatus]|uniref:Uncharacterized protein n=1 Tax=Cylicocyclus nassatus TaxID=53992 RepID=A0AA36GV98_CYLNA|nr:unnamed protein product [Cylicocyclus nassatus]
MVLSQNAAVSSTVHAFRAAHASTRTMGQQEMNAAGQGNDVHLRVPQGLGNIFRAVSKVIAPALVGGAAQYGLEQLSKEKKQ